MKYLIILGVLWMTTTSAMAEPGGCLKYGAGGAVAGHFVGQGHSVLGGAAGCAAGMIKRHQYRKEQTNSHYNSQQYNPQRR